MGNPANEDLTCILRMRLRHNENAHSCIPRSTQPSAVEVVAHHGHDPWSRPTMAVPGSSSSSSSRLDTEVMWFARLSPPTSREISRGSDHVFRPLEAIHTVIDGWWWSCGCVSKRFTIKSHNSHLKEENEEIISCEEELIDKQISSILTEHVRGVTLLFGMPGEGFPRANLVRSVLTSGTRKCKSLNRDGSIPLRP